MIETNVRDLFVDRAVANAVQTREEFRFLLGSIISTLSIDRNWDAMNNPDPAERGKAIGMLRAIAKRWGEQFKRIERTELGVFSGAFDKGEDDE
jgi:hypothetical protein